MRPLLLKKIDPVVRRWARPGPGRTINLAPTSELKFRPPVMTSRLGKMLMFQATSVVVAPKCKVIYPWRVWILLIPMVCSQPATLSRLSPTTLRDSAASRDPQGVPGKMLRHVQFAFGHGDPKKHVVPDT